MKNLFRTVAFGCLVSLLSPSAFAKSCESLFRGSSTATTFEETLTIPFTGETLHVRPSENGGVKVTGGSSSGAWEVTVCRTRWEGRAVHTGPEAVVIEATPRKLVASHEEVEGWTVFFIVRAPDHASLTASTTNGPVTLRDARGTFSIESRNGPLSLRGVEGTVVADLQNGPISFEDLAGEFDLETRNGPISADFREGEWRGARIRATTGNGPISLRSYASFPAGIVVNADGHGPIHCESGCGELITDRHDRHGRQRPRTYRFGPATEDVVLSTTHGPVSIDVTR